MKKLFTVFFTFLLCTFFSCKTVAPLSSSKNISRSLTGTPVMSAKQLFEYFISQNPRADKAMVKRLAAYYIEEANAERINSDVAFAQMCVETGFLRFGNLVTPEMHNYCGLGAIDTEHRGEVFANERLGVRAHIQHLHAYGTTSESVLNRPLIDNRYKWVKPRGKAPTVFELAGTWAADKNYGTKLDSMLSRMEQFAR